MVLKLKILAKAITAFSKDFLLFCRLIYCALFIARCYISASL